MEVMTSLHVAVQESENELYLTPMLPSDRDASTALRVAASDIGNRAFVTFTPTNGIKSLVTMSPQGVSGSPSVWVPVLPHDVEWRGR